MTFGALSAKYLSLRQRLAVHLGPEALLDISIPPPVGTEDELSFIRLVGWTYVLLQETGRVPLNFLKELPPINHPAKLLPEVEKLRTWASHNLHTAKEQDLATLKAAQAWFRKQCGTASPNSPTHWNACFTQLSHDVLNLLTNAISACDALDSEIDGPQLVDSLKSRIERNWEAYRFDKFVNDVTSRFGYTGIEAVSLRKRHLDGWRKVVATADTNSIESLLTLRIEADVLTLMSSALPVSAQELLTQMKFTTPAQLATCMIILKQHSPLPTASISELMLEISKRTKSTTPSNTD
ncbi:hypothetical protein EJ065_3234 [Corallococcus coralloides]|uniref:Uncharacterized protein n=1 Tax=Corallococcus coralloides TaxID=184914 RepID=A0A410RSD7_CORCK|nr:hypothetical protein [Corallococcus coralloides]QAT84798.1 hypothetical protein EJ065_3234 [Corallococcus coralloides]